MKDWVDFDGGRCDYNMNDHRIVFRERLTGLQKLADSRENILTKAEIREFFDGTPLDDTHFEMIYEYLRGQRIQVADTDEEADEARTGGNPGSLSVYLSELEMLHDGDAFGETSGTLFPPEATAELFRRVAAGEAAARDRMVELYLPAVCELAQGYEEKELGKELTVEDLIQEGNIGLLLSLDSIDAFESLAACQAHVLNGISRAMEDVVKESGDIRHMGEQLAGRVNHLNEAIKNLEEDLEHKVTIEELSAYLDMPLEEIRDILRMAGDAIELKGAG